MMELMPYALAPAYGVTSMPFHPGCHRPFYRSTDVRSLPLPSLGLLAVLFDFCLLYASATLSTILLQHFLTSNRITLRPFTLSLYSWCLLLFVEGRDSNPIAPSFASLGHIFALLQLSFRMSFRLS